MGSDILKWRRRPGGADAARNGLTFSIGIADASFSIGVRNTSRQPVTLRSIAVLFPAADQACPPEAADYLEFIHSFSFAALSGVKKVGLASRWLSNNPESSAVYALKRADAGEAMLFSILPPHRGDFVRFQALHDAAHQEGRFGLSIVSEQDRLLRPADFMRTTAIQVQVGADVLALLEDLGRRWGRGRRRPLKPVRRGWNSWDYYAGAVTERNMLANHRAAIRLFPNKLPCMVIDEGWEPRWGAWTANWKFPSGTRGFCHAVKDRGGIPGIWTSPLLVNTYLELYREHPDWFLRNRDGTIAQKSYAYGPMAFLDITHPDVVRWLFGLFRRLKRDGFDYFKVDFTQESLLADRWSDPTVPRGELLRRVFGTIRRAIGKEAYLLACGAPFESVLGIVDAVRVSGDVHTFWGHVLANAASISARWWMHRRVWNIDPDFLIVRAPETCRLPRRNRASTPKPHRGPAEFWLAGREFNEREARTYALLVYVSGGDLFLSDELMTLNERGVTMLRRVLERPLTGAATPVDLFEGHDRLPAFWLAEEADSWFLAVFNWEENPVRFDLDLDRFGIRSWRRVESFWDKKPVAPEGNALCIALPPRTAEGFRLYKNPSASK